MNATDPIRLESFVTRDLGDLSAGYGGARSVTSASDPFNLILEARH